MGEFLVRPFMGCSMRQDFAAIFLMKSENAKGLDHSILRQVKMPWGFVPGLMTASRVCYGKIPTLPPLRSWSGSIRSDLVIDLRSPSFRHDDNCRSHSGYGFWRSILASTSG